MVNKGGPSRSPRGIDHYMGLSYDTRMKKINNKYILSIPELCLVADGEDLKETNDSLEKKKSEYFLKMIDNDLENDIIEPGHNGEGTLGASLFPFFIKLTVIIVLFGGISSYTYISVNSALRKLSGTKVLNYVTDTKALMLEDIVSIGDWPDDKVKRRAMHVNKIVEKLKPIADELKPLFCPEQIQCVDNNKIPSHPAE